MCLEQRTSRDSLSLETHNTSCARLYTRDAQPDKLQMFAQVHPDG